MMVENKEVRRAEEEDPEMLTSVVDRSEKRVMMRGKEEKVHREHESWKEEKRRIGTVRIVTAIVSIRVEITSGMIIILMRMTIMAGSMCPIGVDTGTNINFSSQQIGSKFFG